MNERSAAIRATVLLNPNAGEGAWPPERLAAALRAAGIAPEIVDIKASDPADALRRPADLRIIAGGDGTVAKIAPLLPRGTRFAILPLGTANNVAVSHGLDDDPARLLARLPGASARPFPMLRCGLDGKETVLTEAMGIGALSASLDRAEEGKTGDDKIAEGRRAFAAALREARAWTMRGLIDGRREEREVLMVEALAHGRTGPALQLLPRPVRPGEIGLFSLAPQQREPMLDWLEGGAEGPPPGRVETVRNLRLDCEGAASVRLDDELSKEAETAVRLSIEGVDAGLHLLVPQGEETT